MTRRARHVASVTASRERRRAAGRCTRCPTGRVTINPKTWEPFFQCVRCRARRSNYDQRRYQQRKAVRDGA